MTVASSIFTFVNVRAAISVSSVTWKSDSELIEINESSFKAVEEACKEEINPGIETQDKRHHKSKTGVTVALQKC